MILLLIGAVVFLACIYTPSIWVKHTLEKYAKPKDRYSGSGGQLARELLDRCGLESVKVELADANADHYSPVDKCVRLSKENLNGCSLTAITVAAHEVGHATQDRDNYTPLRLSIKLIDFVAPAQKLGAGLLMFAPLLALLSKSPVAGIFMLVGGLLSLATGTFMQILNLPVEMNASFARALPMLEKGNYLIEGDAPHARRILKACAWTYVAASLLSLLNIGRWWAILRR